MPGLLWIYSVCTERCRLREAPDVLTASFACAHPLPDAAEPAVREQYNGVAALAIEPESGYHITLHVRAPPCCTFDAELAALAHLLQAMHEHARGRVQRRHSAVFHIRCLLLFMLRVQRPYAAQVSAQTLRGLPDAQRTVVLERLAAVRLYAVGARLRCAASRCLGHWPSCVSRNAKRMMKSAVAVRSALLAWNWVAYVLHVLKASCGRFCMPCAFLESCKFQHILHGILVKWSVRNAGVTLQAAAAGAGSWRAGRRATRGMATQPSCMRVPRCDIPASTREITRMRRSDHCA